MFVLLVLLNFLEFSQGIIACYGQTAVLDLTTKWDYKWFVNAGIHP